VTPRRNLIGWLAFHAQRERDLVRLAMAFKLQKPHWGSHATLVAAGLASYLREIDWDLAHAESRFRTWHETASRTHDKSLLLLRATQVKELSDLVLRPRELEALGSREADTRAVGGGLLPRLAQRGLVYGDVRVLAREAFDAPIAARMLPDLQTDDRFRDFYRSRHVELAHVSLDDYLGAVDPAARADHPDVLLRAVLEHWTILARVAAFEGPLVPEMAVRVPVTPKERVEVTAFGRKGIDA
jgi:hypothetical protein